MAVAVKIEHLIRHEGMPRVRNGAIAVYGKDGPQPRNERMLHLYFGSVEVVLCGTIPELEEFRRKLNERIDVAVSDG